MPSGPNRGIVHEFDDFLGKTLNTFTTTISADNDGTVIINTTQVVGGAVEILTGTTDDNMSEIGGGLQWRVQDGTLVLEMRAKVSAITTIAMNFCLNDDINEDSNTLPFELNGTTLTTNAATSIGFLFDTEATNDNFHFAWVDDDADGTLTDTGVAPVADTYYNMVIALYDAGSGNQVRCEAKLTSEADESANWRGAFTATIDRDVLLTWYAAGESRANAARTISLDRYDIEMSRPA